MPKAVQSRTGTTMCHRARPPRRRPTNNAATTPDRAHAAAALTPRGLEVSPIHLGGQLILQPFGLLVVMGCVVGYAVGRWYVGRVGLDQQLFRSLTLWILAPAFLMAHWVSLLVYYPEVLWHDPLQMLRLNASLSSSGGLLGAALGAVLYWRPYGHKTGQSLRS